MIRLKFEFMPNGFSSWFKNNARRLHKIQSSFVADEVYEELSKINDGLGVEVSDELTAKREIIITAFSNSELFLLVKEMVKELADVSDWHFLALKPPRGFDFNLQLGSKSMSAKDIQFSFLGKTKSEILLTVPAGALVDLDEESALEMAWLVVETGIGEELAGMLEGIDISDKESPDAAFPLEQLALQLTS